MAHRSIHPARTRFAQARAELGMTDRTGGPRSQNYAHRRRPENYEEEDEVGSDGEDVVALKTRAAGHDHDPYTDDEDERMRTQDLALARSLRLRAEGLEKVVLSMLDQPPRLLPMSEEDVFTPPTSPQIKPNQRTGSHPHILPDGVRLRMALGTVINDLFARHAPPPPFQPTTPSTFSQTPSDTSSEPPATLPPALTCLSFISAYSPLVPGYNQANYPVSTQTRSTGSVTHLLLQPKTPVKPNARIYSLYMEGADPSTANSPPSFRCPRHLHTGCEICVEARSPVRVVTRPGRSSSAYNQPAPPAPTWMGTAAGMSADGGGITGWQDGSGIGSGLSRSASTGSVLRRKLDETPGGRPGGKLSMLISRFLRLSALAASELGREAREDAGYESPQSPPKEKAYGSKMYGELSPLPGPASTSTMRAIQEAQNRLYGLALRPTRQWYMLLAGLLTRAALEGYLTGEWKGAHAIECLLTVGLGIIEGREVDGVDKDFEEYEPDELPTLSDAARMLFPSLRPGAPLRKGEAEAEYEMEMDERLRRVGAFLPRFALTNHSAVL